MTLEQSTVDEEQLRRDFLELRTDEELANLLGIDLRTLYYYLYRLPAENKYKSFEIPKRSEGMRQILSPASGLKRIQRRLLSLLQVVYEPKLSTHGFVPERSIVTNASSHLARRYICNVDIQDFFPSINFGRVRGMFLAHPYGLTEQVATLLAQICCYDNQLPQGAPTSPIISNMICARMDSELQQLAKRYSCIYTRYADDITFSTWQPTFPSAIAKYAGSTVRIEPGHELVEIIEGNGFALQPEKGRLLSKKHRQEVTGLSVNRYPNTRRRFVREIRGMLHAWDKYGLEAAQTEFDRRYHSHKNGNSPRPKRFEVVLRGKIDFLKMVRGANDPLYLKYFNWYQRLKSPDTYVEKVIPPGNAKIFISYSRKQEVFTRRLANFLSSHGIDIWIDINAISPGKNWSNEINDALQECTLMLLVITPDSMNSRNVQAEWQFFQDKGKPIIPLLLEPTDLHFQLNPIQYVQFHRVDHDQAFEQLLYRLRRDYGC